MIKPSEEKGQSTCPKAILLQLDYTLGSPWELLKLHTPKPHPKAIKTESQGLEFRLCYNFRLPMGALYSKAENGWFGVKCLPKYFWLVLGTYISSTHVHHNSPVHGSCTCPQGRLHRMCRHTGSCASLQGFPAHHQSLGPLRKSPC